MKTASFFTYSGPGRISIARGAPRRMSGFKVYRLLAPGRWFKSVTKEEYERLFNAQLASLSAQRVKAELETLVFPHEPVLLCWERPPFSCSNWCHRHLVAAWFRRELGIDVEEINDARSTEHQPNPPKPQSAPQGI